MLAYYARLFGTFFLGAAFLILVGAGVLVPSYFLAQDEAETTARYASAIEQTIAISESSAGVKTLPTFAEELALLKNYAGTPSSRQLISGAVSVLPKNVSISNISVRYKTLSAGEMSVKGQAATRASLITYVDALKANAAYKGIAVPVEALISDADLEFTLTFQFDSTKL